MTFEPGAVRLGKMVSALAAFLILVLVAVLAESGRPGRAPDLTPPSLTAPASAAPGATIQISAEVSNIGNIAVKSVSVAFSLVPQSNPTGPGTTLTTVTVRFLKPGATTLVVTSAAIPGSTAEGAYVLTMTVDSARRIRESNEENNVRSVPFTVQASALTLSSYLDSTQLDIPWPKHSHYKQPWRAWLETVPADVYRNGVGIDYRWNTARAGHDVEMRFLAESGFSRIRVEVGWDNIDYHTSELTSEATERLTAIVGAAKTQGIRPLILLNANHGWPVPALTFTRVVLVSAPQGSRQLILNDVSEIETEYTGISNLSQYKMAEVIITDSDPATRTVTLSKPLPVALSAGQTVTLHTMKYQPLYDIGYPEYDETVSGWLDYVRKVLQVVQSQGITSFDVEIWNELTFGSDFVETGINDYYDPPLIDRSASPDFLSPGGYAWEMARRTVDMVASEFPSVHVVWGFSNTTFFHTPVDELPPGTRAQSYHPYFFLDYQSMADEQYGFQHNLEQFAPPAPPYRALLPEAAGVFLKTESIARLINPESRKTMPSGSSSFSHFMTEFGFSPLEKGVMDVAQAQLLKAKIVLRASLFWLNKGLGGLWFFADIESGDQRSWDLLDSSIASLTTYPPNPDAYMTPAMTALKNTAALFQSSGDIIAPRQLDAEIAAADGNWGGVIFQGSSTHPSLTYQDVFTILPFQLDDRTFLVATYVMTRNILEAHQAVSFVVKLKNISGTNAQVRYYDPMTGSEIPVQVAERTSTSLTVILPLVDYPHLLWIQE